MAIFKVRNQAQLGTDSRMLALIESFPSLRPCPSEFFEDGFKPVAFGAWALMGGAQPRELGHAFMGRQDAAMFCLSVWDDCTDWDEHVPGLAREHDHGRFNMHLALANWDHEHRAAFIAFCNNPWWP